MAGPFSITKFHEILNNKIDIFICCSSFEDRCKTIPLLMDPHSIQHALVCEHKEVAKYNEKNSKDLFSHFGDKGIKVNLCLNNPLETADQLISSVAKTTSPLEGINYLIDITTFTRESMLILLKLILQIPGDKNKLFLVYNDAQDYSVGLDLPDKWLSKGIKTIRSVLGYPGNSNPSRSLHLIVMAGYEHERAAKLIEAYEATTVSIGFGEKDHSIHANLHEGNITYFQTLCLSLQNINEFDFSLTDPYETKISLEKQVKRFSNCNIVIAPLNNKISTIGAALLAIEDPEVQLCYAQANYYNFDGYSVPGQEFYLFDFTHMISNPINNEDAKNST